MTAGKICDAVAAYYAAKLAQHGATARGVDWNSPASQELRFDQLLKLLPPQGGAVVDYGCGYGALLSYLRSKDIVGHYQGFDISPEMIASARQTHARTPDCAFQEVESKLEPADFAVASGIFNVRMNFSDAEWQSYILDILQRLARLSTAGFGFNMLTSYSDRERMEARLYYGDPCFFFDYCKRNFSRQVALLHDYGLYEFTILVRK